MTLRPLYLLLSLVAASSASAAMTAVKFDGSLNTVTGPGSVAVIGSLSTSYNTVSGFGLTAMAGGNPTVMSFSKPNAIDGLSFTHATPSPNTTGYTILMDVYYTAVPNYLSLLQLDSTADADLFARATGAVGINSSFTGTSFTANAWHRVVMTMNGTQTDMDVYVDGTLANGAANPAPVGGPVTRFNISNPAIQLFTDNDNETAAGFVSQFAFSDRIFSVAEIGGLGGANAAAVPEPTGLVLAGGAAGLALLSRRRRTAVTD